MAGQESLSMDKFNSLLTYDGSNLPTTHAIVVRDEPDVLVYASRSKNAHSEWEVRDYTVLGDGVQLSASTADRARLATAIVESFDADALTRSDRYSTSYPVKDGVPVAVAVDGRPAIAAWLYVRGDTRGRIAERMDVSEASVTEYLSRFRQRGEGLPDQLPTVGEVMAAIPRRFAVEPAGES